VDAGVLVVGLPVSNENNVDVVKGVAVAVVKGGGGELVMDGRLVEPLKGEEEAP